MTGPGTDRERLAIAMYEADQAHESETDPDYHEPVEWRWNFAEQGDYLRRADVAFAVLRSHADADDRLGPCIGCAHPASEHDADANCRSEGCVCGSGQEGDPVFGPQP